MKKIYPNREREDDMIFLEMNKIFINLDYIIYVEDQGDELLVCFGGVGKENSRKISIRKGGKSAVKLTGVLTRSSA